MKKRDILLIGGLLCSAVFMGVIFYCSLGDNTRNELGSRLVSIVTSVE